MDIEQEITALKNKVECLELLLRALINSLPEEQQTAYCLQTLIDAYVADDSQA